MQGSVVIFMPHHVPHPSEKLLFVLHLEAHGKHDDATAFTGISWAMQPIIF